MKLTKFLSIAALALTVASCSKDDDDPVVTVQPAKGVYVLSEGNFMANNTRLGFYSLETSTFAGDYFLQQNPSMTSGLGDTGTDLFVYGGKLYIVVNNSNVVTVLNAANGNFIQNITFAPAEKQPRFGVGVNGKVFVTAYDGTVNVIDTSSLVITQSITVGSNPEGIAVSGNYLYVANSGGFNYPVYDSTVSVISLSTLAEVTKITVSKNPYSIAADESGNVYVSCTGDYNTVPAQLHKISTATNSVTFSADTAVGSVRYYNNKLYVTGGYLGVPNVRTLSTSNFAQTSSNFVTDGTSIMNAYGITIDEQNGDVYITDSKDFVVSGELFCFNSVGVKKFSVNTTPGINPVKVAFVR